jgi:hypothetical protein
VQAAGGVTNSPNITITSFCFESLYEVPPRGLRSLRSLSSRPTILINQRGGLAAPAAWKAETRTCDPPHLRLQRRRAAARTIQRSVAPRNVTSEAGRLSPGPVFRNDPEDGLESGGHAWSVRTRVCHPRAFGFCWSGRACGRDARRVLANCARLVGRGARHRAREQSAGANRGDRSTDPGLCPHHF